MVCCDESAFGDDGVRLDWLEFSAPPSAMRSG